MTKRLKFVTKSKFRDLLIGLEKFLRRPVVVPQTWWTIAIAGIILFIVIFLFLSLYQPFGVDLLAQDRHKPGLILGLIISSIVSAGVFFVRFIFPNNRPGIIRNWQLLLLDLVLYTLIIGVWLMIFKSQSEWEVLRLNFFNLSMLLIDLVFFPVFVLANLFNWRRMRINQIYMKGFSHILRDSESSETDSIEVRNQKGKILDSIKPSRFIFAHACQNYVCYYLKINEEIDRFVIRKTFNSFVQNWDEFPEIIRCHRSYLVNVRYISKVAKLEGRVFLETPVDDVVIPVARGYPIEDFIPDVSQQHKVDIKLD